jgi:hypothetical protein
MEHEGSMKLAIRITLTALTLTGWTVVLGTAAVWFWCATGGFP